MLLRTALLTLALAASAATAASAGAPVGAPAGSADLGPQPQVHVSMDILDADGKVTSSVACDWVIPGDEDRPCLRFQGDPWAAIDAILEDGGVRAVGRTVAEPGLDTHRTISQRGDGSWLFRTTGLVDGERWEFGRVCDPDARRCVVWDAKGTSAKAAIRRSTKRLKRLSR